MFARGAPRYCSSPGLMSVRKEESSGTGRQRKSFADRLRRFAALTERRRRWTVTGTVRGFVVSVRGSSPRLARGLRCSRWRSRSSPGGPGPRWCRGHVARRLDRRGRLADPNGSLCRLRLGRPHRRTRQRSGEGLPLARVQRRRSGPRLRSGWRPSARCSFAEVVAPSSTGPGIDDRPKHETHRRSPSTTPRWHGSLLGCSRFQLRPTPTVSWPGSTTPKRCSVRRSTVPAATKSRR